MYAHKLFAQFEIPEKVTYVPKSYQGQILVLANFKFPKLLKIIGPRLLF
jgi:hypothetical protein